ncbi:hypothetical protein BDV06DRAFT_115176 [Aspergillus oleicola]
MDSLAIETERVDFDDQLSSLYCGTFLALCVCCHLFTLCRRRFGLATSTHLPYSADLTSCLFDFFFFSLIFCSNHVLFIVRFVRDGASIWLP